MYEEEDNPFRKGLARLSKKYLTHPPTSTSVEPLFSATGLFLDDKRNKMLAETVEKLMFLRSNMVVANFTLDW